MNLIKTITKVDFNMDDPSPSEGVDIFYSSCILDSGIVCHLLQEDDDGATVQPIDYPNLNARLNKGQYVHTTPLHILAEAADA